MPPEVLATYAGKYELTPEFVLTVTLEGPQLKGQATGQGVHDLIPVSQTRFATSGVDGAGRVLARVEGYRTVELPGLLGGDRGGKHSRVEAEVASKLKAVMG